MTPPTQPAEDETTARDVAETPTVPQSSDARVPVSATSGQRLLLIAAAVCATWLLLLGTTAVLTANPVTINREQVLRSAVIVVARRDAQAPTRLLVEDVLFSQMTGSPVQPQQTLIVENFDDTGWVSDEPCLVPLSPAEQPQTWQVTPSRLPTHQPLVYPATTAAVKQLQELLKNAR